MLLAAHTSSKQADLSLLQWSKKAKAGTYAEHSKQQLAQEHAYQEAAIKTELIAARFP